MLQEIFPFIFNNEFVDISPSEEDTVLIYTGKTKADESVLCKKAAGELLLPLKGELKKAGFNIESESLRYLFSIDDRKFYLYMGEADALNLPGEYELRPVRALRAVTPRENAFATVTGYHLYKWYRSAVFCGCCGTKTIFGTSERSKICPACGNIAYPRINPAVIVGVIDMDKIVVTRYNGKPGIPNALIAGFCEIGETAEETVRREVFEETGLRVKNIRYYKSQPWGFESDLLLGFFAEVNGSREIVRDRHELAEAIWVSRSEMKPQENTASLTSTMLEAFRTGKERDNT